MSLLVEPFTTVTRWTTLAVESVTEAVTFEPTPVVTFATSAWASLISSAVPVAIVEFNGTVRIPLTCDFMYWSEGAINDNVDDDRWYGYGNALVPLLPNADIAGFGVRNVARVCDASRR
jgi:hypothetical protein